MIGQMGVVLISFFTCGELVLVLWGVGPILGNGYGFQRQNDVTALLKTIYGGDRRSNFVNFEE